MSTRANIIIEDGDDRLWFYRHSDGYPDGTMPSLSKFCEWVNKGLLRDNTCQSAGWLIVIGNTESQEVGKSCGHHLGGGLEPTAEGFSGWKVGEFEPTTEMHGDIQYLYRIDLREKPVKVEVVEDWGPYRSED